MYLKNPRAAGVAAVEEMFRRAGVDLTDRDRAMLSRRAETTDAWSPEERTRLLEWGQALAAGFFDAATDGHEFVDRGVVERKFGTTISANYPEASEVFLHVARAYWSLKTLSDELREEDPFLGLAGALSGLEREIGPLFFPTPSPVKIDPARRERDQRTVLEEYAPRLDVDSFMAGNPILIRDRSAAGAGGCLVLLMAPVAVAVMKTLLS